MKLNEGFGDRVIRMYLGIIIAMFGIFFNSMWALIGIPVFITGIVGLCPLYSLLGINTITPADSEL